MFVYLVGRFKIENKQNPTTLKIERVAKDRIPIEQTGSHKGPIQKDASLASPKTLADNGMSAATSAHRPISTKDIHKRTQEAEKQIEQEMLSPERHYDDSSKTPPRETEDSTDVLIEEENWRSQDGEQDDGEDWGELSADQSILNELNKSDEAAAKQKKEEAQRKMREARGGKREETEECIKCLEKALEHQNKELLHTRDTGDCFYEAFALGLKDSSITVKKLRQQISEYVNKLHQENPDSNWIKETFDSGEITETYDEYLANVQYEADDFARKGAPIWGMGQRDGLILCDIYKVKLCVHEALVYTEENGFKKYVVNPIVYAKGPSEKGKIVEIALYPGHFLGIKTKASDSTA